MVAARYIVFAIGASFSIWCVVVAALTLAGKNVATGHLTSLFPLAYSAIYLVISPIGLSGVLGALNRKTSLIKGFIFQYWISAILLTAMNGLSTYWAHSMALNANRQCQTLIQGTESPLNAFKSCTKFIKTAQLASLIFTCGQGGTMFVLGILLTLAGLREAEDIKIDEETSSLLDRATYDAPKSTDDLTPLRNVHRSNSNSSHTTNRTNLSRHTTNATNTSSNYNQVNVSRNANNASNNYNQVNVSRNATNASNNYNQVNLSRNTTNASSNYNQANLSRNTTNSSNASSNYAPNRQNMNNYNNGYSRPANNPPIKYKNFRPPQANTNVGPLYTPNYIPPVRNQVSPPPPGHANNHIYSPPQAHTKVVQPPNDQYYIDDYQNYWQPTVAKNMAADLTRNGLY